MTLSDRSVLEFIGRQGKAPAQLAERFSGLDIDRLVRADLVRRHRIEMLETRPPGAAPTPDLIVYVLTPAGAEAVGIDPLMLRAA